MAHLQFKGVIKHAGRKENINTYFSKKDITIEGIEEYSGNTILISAINGDSDTLFTEGEIVVVDYQTTVKNYNDKSYGTNQYLSHTVTNIGMFATDDEEDSKSFEKGADGRLLDTKNNSNSMDSLLEDMRE